MMTPRARDPLVGWTILPIQESEKLDVAIKRDYQNYIQSLPAGEKYYVIESEIWFLKDDAGQHAVRIEIPLNGTWWQHVLIYDKTNRRINTVKYASGNYHS